MDSNRYSAEAVDVVLRLLGVVVEGNPESPAFDVLFQIRHFRVHAHGKRRQEAARVARVLETVYGLCAPLVGPARRLIGVMVTGSKLEYALLPPGSPGRTPSGVLLLHNPFRLDPVVDLPSCRGESRWEEECPSGRRGIPCGWPGGLGRSEPSWRVGGRLLPSLSATSGGNRPVIMEGR